MNKLKIVKFYSGRGTSLKGIEFVETPLTLLEFVEERTKQINVDYCKEEGIELGELEGDEEESNWVGGKDGSYSITHGSCDHDIVIEEGHSMWDVEDRDELVKWSDDHWDEVS